ncbi:hypothetical protein NFI96_019185 [Prochilodus magdalenae]|nr:hypothetical protein NFI96_019185 [Prochilodus magdalenae]
MNWIRHCLTALCVLVFGERAEPILHRIQEDRTRVISPSFDNIKFDTFEVEEYPLSAQGFDWELWCRYLNPPKSWWTQKNHTAPIRSPSLIGCFVVDREYFEEIGLLDEGMEVYGGENVELGIRREENIKLYSCFRVESIHRSCKYLGVHLNNKLDWTDNTPALYKKGQSRLHLLRRLRSFGVQGALLRTFYDVVLASAIFYGVVCWSSSISNADRKRLNRIIKKSSSVLGCHLDPVEVVGDERMRTKFKHVLKNLSHPMYHSLEALGSSFSARLLHPRCVKERYCRSFLPAVRLWFRFVLGSGLPKLFILLILFAMVCTEMMEQVWLCGGSVEVLPCSRTAHIERAHKPYTQDLPTHVRRNALRVAEVWMDEYKDHVYMAWNIPLQDSGIDIGDIRERKLLRQRLRCKPFRWFLHNIYSEMRTYGDTIAYGTLKNSLRPDLCVDQGPDSDNIPILYLCHGMTPQNVYYTSSLQLRVGVLSPTIDDDDNKCLVDVNGRPRLLECSYAGNKHMKLTWTFTQGGSIKNRDSKRCLELVQKSDTEVGYQLALQKCTDQKWTISNILAANVLRS